MEAENNALADASKGLANDIESVVPQLEELKAELKIKEAELKEIIKANEKEEAKLKEKRKKIVDETKKAGLLRLHENQKSEKRKGSCYNKTSSLFRLS